MSLKNFEKIQTLREMLLRKYRAALESVDSKSLLKKKLKVESDGLRFGDRHWEWADYAAVRSFAVGKPADQMMRNFLSLFPDEVEQPKTFTVTKKGHAQSRVDMKTVIEASHPVLDGSSLFAGQELVKFLQNGRKYELMIGLISGGGSSLVEVLKPEVEIGDARKVFEVLLSSGASIQEMNLVRKCLSELKGGGLLRNMVGYSLNFILSDVVGNDLRTVSSGLTVPSQPSKEEVSLVIEKYSLKEKLGPTAFKALENYQPIAINYSDFENFILGSNQDLLLSLANELASDGFKSEIIYDDLNESAQSGVSKIIESVKSREDVGVFLFGGELTIEVTGSGKGGRNQELALRIGDALGTGYLVMCIGTDGTDGPTDAAGGFYDVLTVQECAKQGLSLNDSLEKNDSYEFLEKTSSLIKTGPTGTNVMDLYLVMKVG